MTEVVEPVFSEQLDNFLDSFQSSINAAQEMHPDYQPLHGGVYIAEGLLSRL